MVAWIIVAALFAALVGAVVLVFTLRQLVTNVLTENVALEAVAEDYMERWQDGILTHNKIEAGMRNQIQDLAQQLATIRVGNPGSAPDCATYEPKPEPQEPFSTALQEFLNAITSDEGRAMVEEDIYMHRNDGHADEQILDIISGDQI